MVRVQKVLYLLCYVMLLYYCPDSNPAEVQLSSPVQSRRSYSQEQWTPCVICPSRDRTKMDSSGWNLLSVVGGLFVAYHGAHFALQVIHGVRAFILPALGFKKDLRSFGSWAVVTGSTDGIGKSYAKQLAKQGFNIVLMSRNLEKLQDVEEEIKSEYNIKTRIIVIDFSGRQEIYQDIGDRLKDLEIGILVNNVGVGVKCPDYFLTFSKEEALKMINTNILSVVMMTYIVLPMLVARKRGLIINVSSLTGKFSSPYLATYSSTKAFVDFFSYCIDKEYHEQGISVQCVMPGFVSTNMTFKMQESLSVPSADNFVHQALGTIGMEQRTCGYWSHSLLDWMLSNLIPLPVAKALINKMWHGMRKKIYRASRQKQEREKAGHKD